MAQKSYTTKDGLYIIGDTYFGSDVIVKGNLILKEGARLEANVSANGDYIQFFDDVDLAGNKIINVGSAILQTDAANMDYVNKKVGAIIAGAPTDHLQILNDIQFSLENNVANGTSIALVDKADVVYADNLLTAIQNEVLTATNSISSSGTLQTQARLSDAQATLTSYESIISAFDLSVLSFNSLYSALDSSMDSNEQLMIDRAKYYVDGQINQIIGWAPSTLDTLSELANALTELETGVFTTVQAEIDKKIDKTQFDAIANTKQNADTAVLWESPNFLNVSGSVWTVDVVEAGTFVGDGQGLTGLVSPDELPAILTQITQLEAMMTKLEEKVGVLVGAVDTSGVLPDLTLTGLLVNLDGSDTASYPGVGNVWYDISGNGINATIHGDMTFEDQGLSMGTTPTTDKYIELSTVPFESRTTWTMEFVVRKLINNTNNTLLSGGIDADAVDMVLHANGGDVTWTNRGSTHTVSAAMTTGMKQHIMLRASDGFNIEVFVNGRYVDTFPADVNAVSLNPNTTVGMIMGQQLDDNLGAFDSANCFLGRFHAFRFYNRRLTDSEMDINWQYASASHNI